MRNLIQAYRLQYFRALTLSAAFKFLIVIGLGYAIFKNTSFRAVTIYFVGMVIFILSEVAFMQQQLRATNKLLSAHHRVSHKKEITSPLRKVTLDEDV